jgi:asparagine synthase (glutamine-hydrolysing)
MMTRSIQGWFHIDKTLGRLCKDVKNPAHLVKRGQPFHLPAFQTTLAYLDMLGYLPDDILTKVDRTSMAVLLEVRTDSRS